MAKVIWREASSYSYEAIVGKVLLAEVYWNPSLFFGKKDAKWVGRSTFKNEGGGYYRGDYATKQEAMEAIERMVENLAELLNE